MRRSTAALLTLAVAAASACGGRSAGSSSATSASSPSSTTSAPTPAASTGSTAPPTTSAVSRGRPCGAVEHSAGYRHVIVIVMENHGFDQIDGQSPYLNGLADRCGLATNYRAITHPSLPNYMSMTSGGPAGLDGLDCTPGSSCESSSRSIFAQTTWRIFAEGMPSPCYRDNSGSYAPRHNPALYFTDPAVTSACPSSDLPLGGGGPLRSALADPASLAHFVMVIPNLCNDEHDCPVSSGDAWLARMVPQILRSPAYRSGTTALVVTYDEDDHAEGNRVYTVVVSPSTPPHTVSGAAFTHASLLHTTEGLLGLPVLPAAASAATMRAAFNL